MVSVISGTQITSYAQYQQLRQQAVANTTLSPDLQHLADLINDSSGKFSEQDKISAYLTEYNSYQALAGATNVSPDQSHAEDAHHAKFLLEIQNSTISAAVKDAQHKIFVWMHETDGQGSGQAALWASLSDIQKQLPQVQIANPPTSPVAPVQDKVTLSAAAQALFAGDSPVTQLPDLGARLDEQEFTNTRLNPSLQKLANIINDTSGTYSQSDKVSAYTTFYDGVNAICGEQEGGETRDQSLQQSKFLATIANSDVAKAAADGYAKRDAMVHQNPHGGDQQALAFYNSLSDLQRELPEFKGMNVPLLTRMRENASNYLLHPPGDPTYDPKLLEAQLLFGSHKPATESGDVQARKLPGSGIIV